MANSGGLIKESIWRDPEFKGLPRTAQALYLQLISQRDLDQAGVLPLTPGRWAAGCDEMAIEDVQTDLKALAEKRFVVVDWDTQEVFIRSYMRQSNVPKSPNLVKAALRLAVLVTSPVIRVALAVELRRLGREDAWKVATELDPNGTLSEPFPNPLANPSGTLTEGVSKPLQPVDNSLAETLREPFPENPDVGVGVGGNSRKELLEGGTRASAPTPPNPFCKRHPEGTDSPCMPCKRAREAFEKREAWEVEQAKAAKIADAERRRKCHECDESGWLFGVEPVEKCTHKRVSE